MPNIRQSTGYVGHLITKDIEPKDYVRLPGNVRVLYPISDQIFDIGDYIFVPKELYENIRQNKEINSSSGSS